MFDQAKIIGYSDIKDGAGKATGIEVVVEITDDEVSGEPYRGAIQIEGAAFDALPAGAVARRNAVKRELAKVVKERWRAWRDARMGVPSRTPKSESEVAAMASITAADLPPDE